MARPPHSIMKPCADASNCKDISRVIRFFASCHLVTRLQGSSMLAVRSGWRLSSVALKN